MDTCKKKKNSFTLFVYFVGQTIVASSSYLSILFRIIFCSVECPIPEIPSGRTNERTNGHFIVEHWKDVCTLNLHKSPLATHRETSGANVNETDLISPIIWTGPPSLSLLHTLFAHLLKEDWKNRERDRESVCVCVLIKETGA